jgi:D-3-phosphoglycerate dehydrogenase
LKDCLIVQPIHPAGAEVLTRAGIRPVAASSADPASILREIVGASAVITREAGLAAEAIEAAPLLRVIASHGIGTDPIAVETATRRGVAVTNAPHANVRSVAEQALALTLALAKSVVGADAAVRAGDRSFKYDARLVELSGAVFGVVGFGNTGRATAALARSVGMRVVGLSRSQPDAAFAAAGVERVADLGALLAVSDVVSLHLRVTAATRTVIGERELALMKPHAFLINTSRGAFIDETALAAALRDGMIGGAGLDVFQREPLPPDSPLLALSNVTFSPHIAGSTRQALERTAVMAAEQVVAVLAGRKPAHLVNEEVWPRLAAAAAIEGSK